MRLSMGYGLGENACIIASYYCVCFFLNIGTYHEFLHIRKTGITNGRDFCQEWRGVIDGAIGFRGANEQSKFKVFHAAEHSNWGSDSKETSS